MNGTAAWAFWISFTAPYFRLGDVELPVKMLLKPVSVAALRENYMNKGSWAKAKHQ